MRVLVIKMTSMGDVLHTLPAVTDAWRYVEGIRIDWAVEETYGEIPEWHPAVERAIPLALRRWRREPLQWLGGAVRRSFRELRRERYDHIIDAQGLCKSAAIGCLARGRRVGYSADSVRERLAARCYSRRVSTPGHLHAIDRTRLLFAHALGYNVPSTDPNYGLNRDCFPTLHVPAQPYLVFNHGSTWNTKIWPEDYWHDLIGRAARAGFKVLLPWGNESERERAARLTGDQPNAVVLPGMRLGELAAVLSHAEAVISVDTGLGHLTAALGTPAVSIYGATDPSLTGTVGENQHRIAATFPCSPCFSRECTYSGPSAITPACYATVSPDRVWGTLQQYFDGSNR